MGSADVREFKNVVDVMLYPRCDIDRLVAKSESNRVRFSRRCLLTVRLRHLTAAHLISLALNAPWASWSSRGCRIPWSMS